MQSARARALARHTGERKNLVSDAFFHAHRRGFTETKIDFTIRPGSNRRKYGGPYQKHLLRWNIRTERGYHYANHNCSHTDLPAGDIRIRTYRSA
jgi:hypothetical protein